MADSTIQNHLNREITMVSVDELKPHPKNPNSHSKEQIKRLAQILEYQGWRYPIKVSVNTGYITSGHGRLEAARILGLKEVPVSFQEYADDDQEYADIVADNAIASWSELDLSRINLELQNFSPDFDLDMLGIDGFKLDLPGDGEASNDSPYTTKIEIPIYEPTGELPDIIDLVDRNKTEDLIKEINASNVLAPVKRFLTFAAQRHLKFDYEKIAEFYAHSDRETQELFEKSALVIIDFNKAIEHGFVEMTKKIADSYGGNDEP